MDSDKDILLELTLWDRDHNPLSLDMREPNSKYDLAIVYLIDNTGY